MMSLDAEFFGPSPDLAANRELQMYRPCPCGCDERNGPVIGYLSGSTSDGEGVTIYAPDEDTYRSMQRIFGGQP
jgi:hypothetical protein